MRWTVLFLLPMMAGAAETAASSVHTVYIMPMSHGLDQYIANQLTREHVLDVVADPRAPTPSLRTASATHSKQSWRSSTRRRSHPSKKPRVRAAAPDKSIPKGRTRQGRSRKATPQKQARKPVRRTSPKRPRRRSSARTLPAFGSGKGTLFLVDTHPASSCGPYTRSLRSPIPASRPHRQASCKPA